MCLGSANLPDPDVNSLTANPMHQPFRNFDNCRIIRNLVSDNRRVQTTRGYYILGLKIKNRHVLTDPFTVAKVSPNSSLIPTLLSGKRLRHFSGLPSYLSGQCNLPYVRLDSASSEPRFYSVCIGKSVGLADTQSEDFRTSLDSVLLDMQNFNMRFVQEATDFLARKLTEWGFRREEWITG